MKEYVYKTSMGIYTDASFSDPPTLTIRNDNLEEIRRLAIKYMDEIFVCHLFCEDRFSEAEEYLKQRNDNSLNNYYKTLGELNHVRL